MARPSLQSQQTTAEDTSIVAAPPVKRFPRQATRFPQLFMLDVSDNGQLREVALVKEDEGGSIYYIDILSLDLFDKGRIKTLVTSQHATMYPLWDLMSQQTLSNGKNALDYFHQLVRVKQGAQSVNTVFGGGLSSVRAESTGLVGQEFTNPNSAVNVGDTAGH
jgi:hypothetical protein